MADVQLIDANALKEKLQADHDFYVHAWGGFKNLPANDKARVDELTASIAAVVNAPTVDAVPVVRCRECKNGAPLPEEAMADFSPGVMRCLAGRGDCDRYCTTWEDGFCDEGVKKDGGADDV